MVQSFIKIFLTLSFIILFLYYPSNITASNILLQENFNDGNANDGNPTDWEESSNNWSVVDGKYRGTANYGGPITTSLGGNPNWSDYSLEVEMTGIEGVDRHILFRFSEYHVKGYSIKYREENSGVTGLIELQKHGQNVVLQTNYSFKPHTGETHKLKIVAVGNRIKVFVDADQEPAIDYTDNDNPILEGKVGFLVEPSGIGLNTTTLYDNLVVEDLSQTNSNLFDLPVAYTGRPNATQEQFKNTFWSRLTAAFDHNIFKNVYVPFTGTSYTPKQCPNGKLGIDCYDTHNGTDLSQVGGTNVLSVSDGTVVFASEQNSNGCVLSKGGFGCVVIAYYPSQNVYGLYAHLSRVDVAEGDQLNVNSQIGVMGSTGCGKCGTHIHFGVMKELPIAASSSTKILKMSKKDWDELLFQIEPTATNQNEAKKTAFCTYSAPNGMRFAFQDPSGWKGIGVDPWSLPQPAKSNADEGGCGVESPYLWKFDVGTNI